MVTRRETFVRASALLSPLLAESQTRRLTVPFELSAGRGSLLLRARLNGRTATLILDTGSSHTIVNASFLGLRRLRQGALAPAPPGIGVLGDAIGAEVTLALGTISSRRRVAVMDLTRVLSNYQERIDGLLGLDFLLEFSLVSLSVRDRTVTLVR